MWPTRIVLPAPPFNDHLGLPKGIKQFSLEELITKFAMKRFHIAILPGTPRLNE
jgi:hypothetical protein